MDYLKTCGLGQHFETIIISEIVGVSKPNTGIMQFALDDLDLKAKDCLYVGDHPYDVLCSKGKGMDCAWIATDERVLPDNNSFKEDYRISRIMELLNIL